VGRKLVGVSNKLQVVRLLNFNCWSCAEVADNQSRWTNREAGWCVHAKIRHRPTRRGDFGPNRVLPIYRWVCWLPAPDGGEDPPSTSEAGVRRLVTFIRAPAERLVFWCWRLRSRSCVTVL